MANTTEHLASLLIQINEQGYNHPGTPGRLLAMAEGRLRILARIRLRGFPQLGRWVQTDDLLQNVMLKLNQSLEKVRPDTIRQFFGLAALHIKRCLLDLQRSINGPNGFGTRHQTDSEETAFKFKPEPSTSHLEDLVRFNELTECLEPQLKEVVDLIFIHGLTQEEAATVLGLSHRTVKRKWLQARVILGEKLGNPPDSQQD